MKIICDLDGTIFKTYERLANCFQIHFKRNRPFTALVTGEGLTDEERYWVREYYFRLDLAYIGLPVYKDAVPVLQSLSKFNEIYFVSARPIEFMHLTAYELYKQHLPIKNLFLVMRGQKVNFITNLSPDWVIDDETFVGVELALRQIKTILLRRDWNLEAPDVENLFKVKEWLEVHKIITETKKEGGD